MTELSIFPIAGLPEFVPGDDLAGILAAQDELQEGDVLVVTQKVVSKAEGRLETIDTCLLYTSPSPRDQRGSRMPSSA